MIYRSMTAVRSTNASWKINADCLNNALFYSEFIILLNYSLIACSLRRYRYMLIGVYVRLCIGKNTTKEVQFVEKLYKPETE